MRQISILYAEDYDLVLSTVKQLFELEGWKVDLCRDGESALARLESPTPYDLIVFDCEMPGIGGLELLRRARAMTHRRRTPVIVFTASNRETAAGAAGADAFLRKPNGIRDLIHVAERLLNRPINPYDSGEHQAVLSQS